MANEYATLAEFKARVFSVADTVDDTIITAVLESISRAIDQHCGRHFYRKAAETRYFTAEAGDFLVVDDLLVISTLKTDEDGDRVYETTWAATDYDLMPLNAALRPTPAPFTWIQPSPRGNYAFPTGVRGVEIASSDWGWAVGGTTPGQIREATLLWAARLFARKDAIFGVVGAGELGTQQAIPIPKIDPDVKILLAPFIRLSLEAV